MKKTFNELFKDGLHIFTNEFVYGGHLPALGISGLVLSVVILFSLPINLIVLIIPYLSTQVVYSYNHIKEVYDDAISNPERSAHITKQKSKGYILLAIYALLLVLILLVTNLNTVIFVVAIVCGGILYTEFFKSHITKYVLGFKNFYTSVLLASSIFLVPILYQETNIKPYFYVFLIVSIRLFVNTVFFDIKDVESDGRNKLKTLPVIYGVRNTIYFLLLVNLLSIIPLLIGIFSGLIPTIGLSIIFFIVYASYYLLQGITGDSKRIRIFSYLIADAEYVLWPILIFISKLMFTR